MTGQIQGVFFPESYPFSDQLEPDVSARTGDGTSS